MWVVLFLFPKSLPLDPHLPTSQKSGFKASVRSYLCSFRSHRKRSMKKHLKSVTENQCLLGLIPSAVMSGHLLERWNIMGRGQGLSRPISSEQQAEHEEETNFWARHLVVDWDPFLLPHAFENPFRSLPFFPSPFRKLSHRKGCGRALSRRVRPVPQAGCSVLGELCNPGLPPPGQHRGLTSARLPAAPEGYIFKVFETRRSADRWRCISFF